MKKIIKRIGSSIGIILNREECEILKIKKGDIVDIDIEKVK